MFRLVGEGALESVIKRRVARIARSRTPQQRLSSVKILRAFSIDALLLLSFVFDSFEHLPSQLYYIEHELHDIWDYEKLRQTETWNKLTDLKILNFTIIFLFFFKIF